MPRKRTRARTRLRVLHSAPPPGQNVSYVDSIVAETGDIDFDFFTWRKILTRRYDVLHVHWPEMFVRGTRNPLRLAMFFAMLARLRLSGTRVVRTLHNVEPHERITSSQRRLLASLDALTDEFIRLNPFTTSPVPAHTTLIPHGDYRRPFSAHPHPERERGRIVYFGLIRPYKGVEQLVTAFSGLDDDTASLHVVGRVKGDAATALVPLAAADERVRLALRFVNDVELVAEVCASELVVLPYRHMHNSGSLFAALSLDRPVLAPTSDVNRWIAEEVGSEWLMLYEGELDAAVLATALERARRLPPDARVEFSGRSWADVSRQHAELYERTVSDRPRATATKGRGSI